MINRPLFVPAGVKLVPLTADEESQPIDHGVLVCEGKCRPSWTPHSRAGSAITLVDRTSTAELEHRAARVRTSDGTIIKDRHPVLTDAELVARGETVLELKSPAADMAAHARVTSSISPRFSCDYCGTVRRWGS